MTSNNVTDCPSNVTDPALQTALLVTSSIALIGCTVCLITKLLLGFVIPIAWKCCLMCQDVAFMAFSLGLLLISCHIGGASGASCTAGGFFTVFGVLDLASSLTFMGITLILIQNPSKMSHLSKFRWGGFLAMVVLQKVVIFILAAIPVLPLEDFDQCTPYPLECFPVRQEGAKGATFGAILFFIMWVILAASFILCVVVAVKFWAGPGTRVHASSPSLWQMQKMEQGRTLHKFNLIELGMALVLIVLLTALVYGNKSQASAPQWAGLLTFAALVTAHVILAIVQLTMWSSLCCDRTGHKKEPHHRLKQLELIRTEGPGRVRLKASWAAGKGVWKQGLLKVYGPEHIKAWAQEIVVLGLLRKSHSASVLQCLWTSNSNPYYETMTLISGNIVANDSRLTCLELTSSGTLQDLLKKMDTPLPDQCQRTIMHDIAEGLSYLHAQNVLHRNLTSAAVYLKGSVQYSALRAAVGDFEDAQIYGTFLTGSSNSNISRKRFLYPDIRAYALVGIEMLARVCECQQHTKQPKFRNSNQTWAQQPRHKVFHRPYHEIALGVHNEGVDTVHQSKAQARRLQENGMWSSSNERGGFQKHNLAIVGKDLKKMSILADVKEMEESSRDYNIDQNWKLQARSFDMALGSNWKEKTKINTTSEMEGGRHHNEDGKHHNEDGRHPNEASPHAARITLVKEASENSVFHHHSNMSESVNTIEEEIFETGQRYKRKVGEFQQAGYVTSKTEDGREVFVPATLKVKKNSAASSSGYGSGDRSTSVLSEHNTISEKAKVPGVKQVYRPVSPGQPTETDTLDVLPGMTDRSKRGDEIIEELFKAKKDAEVEQLLESYDERVRRELGTNSLEVPYGVLFPKPNTKTMTDIPGSLNYNVGAHLQDKDVLKDVTVTSTRPNTASTSTNQSLQRSSERPMSAGNMASTIWNPRSSMKRTKARTALKKALNNKEVVAIPQLQTVAKVRGTRAQEIELKYNKTPRNNGAASVSGEVVQTQVESIIQNIPEMSTRPTQLTKERKPVTKVRSTKSRPAPQPPTAQTPQAQHPTAGQAPQAPKPHTELTTAAPVIVDRTSSLNSFNDASARLSCRSSSTADADSSDSDSSSRANHYTREQISVEKIESDMNEIINSSKDPAYLPPGVKLIDSGFDSASVSSEESCLCAASALQAVEDGSCSGPSENFSQGTTCSCACSNCLGSSQRNKNSSSWTGSQDSESWSNSNSFSSYDVNMHRRKLTRGKGKSESLGCVLAPDEQYPSPGHRSHSWQRRGSYKLKRNHRHLAHTREHYTSSSSDASSAASRRYRELLKKGIAFKVSVIPGDSRGQLHAGTSSLLSPLAEHFNNEAVVANGLDGISDLENENEEEERDTIHTLSPIPSLDDIIKEIPDETGKYSEESRAFINRPESELSLKALQEVLTGHGSASDSKNKIPKELMIERIFNHQGPPINMPSNFGLRGTQDVDDSVIREVAMLPGREEAEDSKDVVGLLSGMDGRHIRFCHGISSRVSIVRMSDLLPANNQTFDKLAMRLRNSGDISTAGHQILDLMRTCWLNEAPPTTTAILSQLTDPVTETEL